MTSRDCKHSVKLISPVLSDRVKKRNFEEKSSFCAQFRRSRSEKAALNDTPFWFRAIAEIGEEAKNCSNGVHSYIFASRKVFSRERHMYSSFGSENMLIGNRVKTHKNSISSNWPLDEIIRPIPDFHFPIAAFQFRFNISNLSSGWLVSAARWSIQFASQRRRSNFAWITSSIGWPENENWFLARLPDLFYSTRTSNLFLRSSRPQNPIENHVAQIRLAKGFQFSNQALKLMLHTSQKEK